MPLCLLKIITRIAIILVGDFEIQLKELKTAKLKLYLRLISKKNMTINILPDGSKPETHKHKYNVMNMSACMYVNDTTVVCAEK